MSQKREIVGVQYLRGLAAFAVVVDHTSGMAALPKYFGRELFDGYLSHGGSGVDLFFVISGFIICVTALSGPTLASALTPKTFVEKRFIRIIPLMWVAILSYILLRYLGRGTVHQMPYIRAFFLLPTGSLEPNQIWTLRHEIIFYAVFCISVLGSNRRWWLLSLWVFSPFVYAMLRLHPTDSTFDQLIWIVANPVNIEFGTGVLVGIAWHKWTKHVSLQEVYSPFGVFTLAIVVLITIGFLVGITFDDVRLTSLSALMCGAILFTAIHTRCHSGVLDRLAKLLGDASYSVYLFHPHVLSAILGAWAQYARGTPIGLVLCGSAIVATCVGVSVHLLVEKPLLRFVRSLFGVVKSRATR